MHSLGFLGVASITTFICVPVLAQIGSKSGNYNTYVAQNSGEDSTTTPAQQGRDPELKAWAGQKVPTLQAHLQLATNIARR